MTVKHEIDALDAETSIVVRTVRRYRTVDPAEQTRVLSVMAEQILEASEHEDDLAKEGRRGGIQVIERAAAILRALEGDEIGLSLGQIAKRVDLARSTVQRIVEALEAEQLVMRAGPNGGLRLGPAIIRMARAVDDDLARLARPSLTRLSHEFGETVDLSFLRGDKIVFVDQIVGTQRLLAVSAVGEAFPLYCTAPGKACLAQKPDREVRRLLAGKMARLTPHTITDLDALLAELAETRRTGIAFDREEHTLGICAVGTSFRDPFGGLAAISVPVPQQRFRHAEKDLAEALLDVREELDRVLGGNARADGVHR